MVGATDADEVEEYAEGFDHPCGPEGGVVAEVLDEETSSEYTQAYTEIPRGEERGVGCSAMAGRAEADEHGLEGGPQMAITQADEEGGSVVAYLVVEEGEEQVAEATDESADGGIVQDAALTQGAAADESRTDESTGQQGEEKA